MNPSSTGSSRIFTGRRSLLFAPLISLFPLTLPVTTVMGQETPPSEEVYEMSPFIVTAAEVDGYWASESTTGTRIASNIQELPFAVGVVTSEFFDDFQSYDLKEQFAYQSSFVYDGEVAQYYLRGFRSSFQLRNGFARAGLFSKVTTDRAEVIKGPLAAIYGRAQPGGVVNYITKRPTDEWESSLRLSVGTDAHYRGAFSASGPIIEDKLRFRFDTSYRSEEMPQGGLRTPFTEESVISGVFDYAFSEKTRLTVEMDRTVRSDGRPSRVPLLYQDLSSSERQSGAKRYLGLAYDVVDLGLSNLPGTQVDREVDAINVMLEHRFNSVWTLRLAGDYADRLYEDLEMYSFVDRFQIRDRAGAETALLINREPRLWIQEESYGSAAGDLLATFLTGEVEHKVLFTADYYSFENHSEDYRLHDPENAQYNEYILDPLDNEWLFVPVSADSNALDPTRPEDDPGPFRVHNVNTRQLDTAAGFLSWRAASLGRRLITLAGVRRERTRYERFYEVRSGSESIDIPSYSTWATTAQLGATFKLTQEHFLFAGYSESYDPNRAIDLEGNPLPDEQGKGLDVGIKSSINDGKINFTLTYFTIDRENIEYEVDEYIEDENRYRTASAAAGLVTSEGVELEFNLRLLDHDRLNLFGGYTYNETEVKEAGRDLDLVGRRWERVPLNQFKLGGRFSFRETALHGLVVTAGIRYQGEAVYGNGVAETLAGDGPNERSGNDGRREIMEPSSTLVDLGASYSWGSDSTVRHTLQLNVKNATDFDKPTNGGRVQDPRRVIMQYRIDF